MAYAAPYGLGNNKALADIQYQNQFDQPLNAHCHGADGMYKVQSVHDNHREDRVWNWECRRVLYHGYPKCYDTGYVITVAVLSTSQMQGGGQPTM